MSHFEDEAGNEFIIVKGDDAVPPGVERLEFSSREEVEAFLLKLTATPRKAGHSCND